jgi:hypothetical protein
MSKRTLYLPYSFEESIARIYALHDNLYNKNIFKKEYLIKNSHFTISSKFKNIIYYIYDQNNKLIIDFNSTNDLLFDELVLYIYIELSNIKPKSFKIYAYDDFFPMDDDEEKIILYEYINQEDDNKTNLNNNINDINIKINDNNNINNNINNKINLNNGCNLLNKEVIDKFCIDSINFIKNIINYINLFLIDLYDELNDNY